jgi:serpin B
VDDDQLAETFRQVNEKLDQAAAPIMEDTRAIYVAQGPTIREKYAQLLQQVFGMNVNLVDFSDPVTLELINDWVGRVTEGRVDRIFEELPEDTNTLLIDNVICSLSFARAFDPEATSPQAFTADGGSATVTPMMYAEQEVDRTANAEVDALYLPLAAPGCEVWYLLPAQGTTLSQLLGGLTMEKLTAWRDAAETATQKFFIPTVDISCSEDLLDDLSAMGVTALTAQSADSAGNEDLSAMGSGIRLTQLRHRTLLKISEQGSEPAQEVAVGAPYLAMQEGSAYVANRSFALLIVDRERGTILFTGAYRAPQ